MSLTGDFAELEQFVLDPTAIRALPRSFCERHQLVVLGTIEPASTGRVKIGSTREPHLVDPEVREFLSTRFACEIEFVRLNEFEISRALQTAYQPEAIDSGIRIDTTRIRREAPLEATNLVEAMLWDAVRLRASDLHIETYHDDVDVRLRIDGIMHQIFTDVHADNVKSVVTRLKVMASLNLTEHRRALDGRFRATFVDDQEHAADIDFRVNVLPGPAGPSVVVRVLDPDLGLLRIDDLGMSGGQLRTFKRLVSNPEGLVIVTGPTGSGKTTTLYSVVSALNDGDRKIITVEDPIEYRLGKVSQKQVSDEMTMGDLMRATLRQDPDVLLFGEVRDTDSAAIAVMAATTGHLVLTTLHTSDAIGSVVRLRNLGVDDYDIANTIIAVVAQRLVRTICATCREPVELTDEQSDRIGDLLRGATSYSGAGCEQCHGSGYRGRTGIYELLVFDEALQGLVASGAHRIALRHLCRDKGFRTLLDDALDKVRAGLTTVDELIRIVPYRDLELMATGSGLERSADP